MLVRTARIGNPVGLHTRTAVRLVQCAEAFRSDVELQRDGFEDRANCKSILSLLLLVATKGTILTVRVEGPDEVAAADAIVALLERDD